MSETEQESTNFGDFILNASLMFLGGTLGFLLGKSEGEDLIKRSHLKDFEHLIYGRVDTFPGDENGSTRARIIYGMTTAIFENRKLYIYDTYMTKNLELPMGVSESVLMIDLSTKQFKPVIASSEEDIHRRYEKAADYTDRYTFVVDTRDGEPSILEIVNNLIDKKILSIV